MSRYLIVGALLIGSLAPAIADTIYIPEILRQHGPLESLVDWAYGDKTQTWEWYTPERTEKACVDAIGKYAGNWDAVADWKCARASTTLPAH